MAFRHGKNAAFTFNSAALGTFMDTMDTSFDLDIADTTTYGATWKSGLPGIPGGKLDIAGKYDPTASTGPGAVLYAAFLAGTAYTGLIYPGGTASGQILYTVTSGVICTAFGESSPVGGIVSFKASFMITVAPVRTVI